MFMSKKTKKIIHHESFVDAPSCWCLDFHPHFVAYPKKQIYKMILKVWSEHAAFFLAMSIDSDTHNIAS